MSPKRYKRSISGFTLLEVLVAITMLAIALPALIKTVGSNIHSAADLKQRTVAQWVAMNRIAELQATKAWPNVGESSGSETMAQAEWFWEVKVSKTDEVDMRRIDVGVKLNSEEKKPIVSLEAYLGKP